jgi:DNA-binding NarL/FixJ family response regulator
MNLLIVDDHAMFRDALVGMIGQWLPDARISTADTGMQAMLVAKQVEPEFVIMDFNMPGWNGLETAKRLLQRYPYLAILCLSVRTEESLVRAFFEAGIRAYLRKDDEFDTLREAFSAVRAGLRYISPALQNVFDPNAMDKPAASNVTGFCGLTVRQRDVLSLIASGLSTRDIAAETGLSTKTLDAHRRRIQERLGVDSVAELTRVAIREGLVDMNDPQSDETDQPQHTSAIVE